MHNSKIVHFRYCKDLHMTCHVIRDRDHWWALSKIMNRLIS